MYYCSITQCLYFFKEMRISSPVENQYDLELDLKDVFFVMRVVEVLNLMNPIDVTLASLSALKY